jgi:hypothetical protein
MIIYVFKFKSDKILNNDVIKIITKTDMYMMYNVVHSESIPTPPKEFVFIYI